MHLRATSLPLSFCCGPTTLCCGPLFSLNPYTRPTFFPLPSSSLYQPRHTKSARSMLAAAPLDGSKATDHTDANICSDQAQRQTQQQPQAGAIQEPKQPPLVQYVVLRRDLWTGLKWPLGSIVAQACHASTAALHLGIKGADLDTATYCSDANIDSMHKVVLEVKDEKQLRDLSAKLSAAGIRHKLWIEQPEDYATSLATKPYPKLDIAQHFKKLQLCKASFS